MHKLDCLLPRCRRFSSRNLFKPRYIHVSCTSLASKRRPDKWDYSKNSPDFTDTPEQKSKYAFVTAEELATLKDPPTSVRMLAREFIQDSLYNPNYGYFSKQATIFKSSAGAKKKRRVEESEGEEEGITQSFDFGGIRNAEEFQAKVGEAYEKMGIDPAQGPGKQIWHTPTELFRPWYGQAIARCLISEYLLKYFPYEDFVIYEIGAGNGTLAMDILNYVQELYPEVYDRMRYHIIEISEPLANEQRRRLLARHPDCVVKVHKKSVFEWDKREPAPCSVVMMEVVDNFAHDVIRYDLRTLQPYQGIVEIDSRGDFNTVYMPVMDSLIKSFLSLRSQLSHQPPNIPSFLRLAPPYLRKLYTSLPLTPNLSSPEYIPTRLVTLLSILHKYFPRHRLLLSDFSSLPDTIPGINAPVVQTRIRNSMVPCSTFLVKQGYFDIFFPTNFERLKDMYEHILSEPASYLDPSSSAPHSIYPDRPSPLAPWSSAPYLQLDSSPSVSGKNNAFFFSNNNNRRRPLDGVASASGLPVGERKSSVFTHAEFLETYADTQRTRLMNGENPMLEYYKNVKFLF